MLVTKIHGGWKWSADVSYSDQQHEVKVKNPLQYGARQMADCS